MSTTITFPQTSGLKPHTSQRAPSAVAKLRALLARLINVDGPTLETDLLSEYTTEAAQGIAQAAETSTRTEGLVERLRRHVTEFMADGRINPRERRILAQDQRALAQSAHATTEQLNTLR